MKDNNFTTTITVDQSPQEVFDAVNNLRGWWSEEINGRTDELDGEFSYRHKDLHRCRLQVTALVPGKKVEWLVIDNDFSFTKDRSEWTGTRMLFEISEEGEQTRVRFTHVGLSPQYECFEICSDAWSFYITESLRSLIVTGKGQPNSETTSRTEKEKELSTAAP